MKQVLRYALAIGFAGLLSSGAARLVKAEAGADAQAAVAIIHGAGDNKDKITGTASFTPSPEGVKIVVDVNGLPPGKHGIHIHEKSDLSSPDLKSAGPHFNPDGASHKHGGPDDPERHAGDLGNIEADSSGHGHLETTDAALSIDNAKNGVVGHSIIIHANEDDLKSQPAGNSGDRIAGGAINVREAGGKKPGNGKD